MAEYILSTENLCKSFGAKEIVKMVNLEVKAGEVYGLVGPTGAGKTTTISLITGYYQPTSGKTTLCGENIAENERECKKRFGFLPERTGFYEIMSARENLEFFASLYDLPKEEVQLKVDGILEYVGLNQVAHKPVKTFTPGMVQRLGLAKALIHQPEILILDEPLAQMDLEGIKLVRQTIQRLAREGRTVLFTSHYFIPVRELCSTIGVMVEGELVYQGDPLIFINDLKDSYHKYAISFDRDLYGNDAALHGVPLIEQGVQILDYDYDKLVVASEYQEEELRTLLRALNVEDVQIQSLPVSDEELFYHYCSQYQELREIADGGGGSNEEDPAVSLDGVTIEFEE